MGNQGGNDENAGNQGENDENQGGDAGNQGRNDENLRNQGGKIGIRVRMQEMRVGMREIYWNRRTKMKVYKIQFSYLDVIKKKKKKKLELP